MEFLDITNNIFVIKTEDQETFKLLAKVIAIHTGKNIMQMHQKSIERRFEGGKVLRNIFHARIQFSVGRVGLRSLRKHVRRAEEKKRDHHHRWDMCCQKATSQGMS
ncbi:hypothetical protein CEXT_133811 [Caerostris extrusa]|uniref:Uncharacterized protein n=1 Tax=Caerostris extrusa TaxID=172846 RepID=A0AAV4V869_CAEEX|nr:hypothetical protein CEXT_133811 [Caerostris extrusa]